MHDIDYTRTYKLELSPKPNGLWFSPETAMNDESHTYFENTLIDNLNIRDPYTNPETVSISIKLEKDIFSYWHSPVKGTILILTPYDIVSFIKSMAGRISEYIAIKCHPVKSL